MTIIEKLQQAFAVELGEKLAQEVAQQFMKASDSSLDSLKELFYQAGCNWSASVYHWAQWVQANTTHPPVLMMRDTKPLTMVPVSSGWSLAWLNRSILGVMDELSGHRQKEVVDPLASQYMTENGLHQPFTFVDTGAWGTMVQRLVSLGIEMKPLFFYSHNPNIPGFLNVHGFDNVEGERINDSLECAFPNIFLRPDRLVMNGKVEPVLIRSDEQIAILGEAALKGVADGVRDMASNGAYDSIGKLVELSERAKRDGVFTGVLHRNSPTWSKGAEFLAQWPKHLKWT